MARAPPPARRLAKIPLRACHALEIVTFWRCPGHRFDSIFSGILTKVKGSGRGARSTHSQIPMTQAMLKGKYTYRRRLPHYQKDDRAVFVTFCCSFHPLPESVRDMVFRHCLHDQGTKATIHAVVVMPDHVHLLLTPLRDPEGSLYSLVEILQGIKSASAHSLNRALGRAGPVWQEESFDHVLRSASAITQNRPLIIT